MDSLVDLEGLVALDDATLRALRDAMASAGYAAATIDEGERIAPGALDAIRLPLVHAAWADDPSPARALALLFSYDAAVPEGRVAAALGAELTRALRAGGALVDEGGALRSLVRVTPFLGLWIVSDPLHAGAEAVMGPGPTTLEIAAVLPSRPPPRVLDVGCGAGTLALVAASRGATEVTGADVSARAVALSRVNARLNGLAARFVESDLTAAVAGERFDLVVSQPAFIAQPPDVAASTFAHGGAMGDELAMRLLGEVPRALAPGGQALVLVQAPTRAGAPLHARVRQALGDDALSLLVLAARGLGVDLFSVGYASLVDPSLGPAWREAALRYRAHLRAMGIDEFTNALIAARAEGAGGYTVTLPMNGLRGFDSEALAALQEALSLASRDDRALGAARVRASQDVTWVEERARPDSSLAPRWVARFRRGGFADRELGEATWVLLGILDGASCVDEAVAGYAEACGVGAEELRAQVLGFVRESLARGLLVVSA